MRRRRFMDEFGPVIFYTVIALMVVALFFVCFAFSRKAAPAGTGTESSRETSSSSLPDGPEASDGAPFDPTADPSGSQGDSSGESSQPEDPAGGSGEEGQPADPSGNPAGDGQPGDPSGDPSAGDSGNGASAPTVTGPDGTVFQAVNETVYALENVNMRTAPSTDGSILAILNRGQSVTRTGVSEFGWSQIVYEGNTVYVSSDYIGTSAP